MEKNDTYIMYFVIILIILIVLYYVLCIISDKLSFKPDNITDDDVNNLKKKYKQNIKIGQFDMDNGQRLSYALFNKYKEPSWDDRITFYCHGNGGWIGSSVESLYFSELSKHSSIFVFDYRGYGVSPGTPSEDGLYEDTKSAWKFVTKIKKIKPENMLIFGHSMGTSTSSFLIKTLCDNGEKVPKTLILSAPFYNFVTISTDLYPGIGRFNTNVFETNKYLRSAKDINIIYVHSKDDEMIHYYHSYKLNAEVPGDFYMITGTHSDPILSDESKVALYKAFQKLYA